MGMKLEERDIRESGLDLAKQSMRALGWREEARRRR
jgi:hypothetical protein